MRVAFLIVNASSCWEQMHALAGTLHTIVPVPSALLWLCTITATWHNANGLPYINGPFLTGQAQHLHARCVNVNV